MTGMDSSLDDIEARQSAEAIWIATKNWFHLGQKLASCLLLAVKLVPGLCELLRGRFQEFVVSHGSNKLVKCGILIFNVVGLGEGGNLESGSFLCESLQGLFGLGQVQGDSGDGLGEPRFVT